MSPENRPEQNQSQIPDQGSEREQLESLRSREIEPIEFTKLNTLSYVEILEKADGAREEENTVQWPLSIGLQTLTAREVAMNRSVEVLQHYAKARPRPDITINGQSGWYENVPASYGFEVRTFKNKRATTEFDDPFITVVRLGVNEERTIEAENIRDFTRNVLARMKFAGLYGHVFKRNIENASGLATLYLASADIKQDDLKSLLTLPAAPEDLVSNQELKSQGGIVYPKETALGDMMVSAWAIFNAVGLSEKPQLFDQFTSLPGWKKHVMSNPDLGAIWFGDPKEWAKIKDLKNNDSWRSEPDKNKLRTKDTWVMERENKTRLGLAQWGNIFVRENKDDIEAFKTKAVEYLGGSETAKQAVELGWKYFRLFAAADFVGYEWYYDEKKGVHATIPLGGDTTSDFGKAIHPDAYLEFYNANERGGIPRGAYGKIEPFAVDVLRGLVFGDEYKLPDGKEVTRPSLYDLLYVHGLKPDEVLFDKLPDRAIISPYLRFFMANPGSEFGGGSFDMLTDKITSPDPYLSPAFWEKLKSKVHVGITKENVAWVNFTKNGGREPYKIPDSEEVNRYKLNIIRTMLDAIFAEEISRKWDAEPEKWGPVNSSGKWEGTPSPEARQYPISWRIIATANEVLGGLNYTTADLEKIRNEFLNKDKKQNRIF